MTDPQTTSSINIGPAAAVYLSAKTETVVRHDQGNWFDSTTLRNNKPDCGTTACIAGHIMLFHHGNLEKAVAQCSPNGGIEHDAFEALTGLDPTEPMRAYEYEMFYDLMDNIFYCMDEEWALQRFKKWVQAHSTDSEWAEFQQLVDMEPNKLLQKIEYAA